MEALHVTIEHRHLGR